GGETAETATPKPARTRRKTTAKTTATAPESPADATTVTPGGEGTAQPTATETATGEGAAQPAAAETTGAQAIEGGAEPAASEAAVSEAAVSAGEGGGEQAEPMPGYANLTIASLRSRLRGKSAEQVHALLDYEKAHTNRPEVVRMFQNRLSKLQSES
ncbi:hypothetical protein AB0C10_24780, partial [Microbispora amethystogenes]|uniref:hypothetical protein n=1 Tax=Microbispora amethystogenes TaxID=1427754 RepID=UPI0033E9F58F